MSQNILDKFDARELNDTGLVQLPENNLLDLMEFVMQGGRRISIQGVVRTAKGREVIIIFEDLKGLKEQKATDDVGFVKDISKIGIGISVIPATYVVDAAQEAKKKNLAVRLLGPANEKHDGKDCYRVQCFRFGESDEQFPQDFWMNHISDSEDMNEALMQVVARRS